MCSQYNNRLVYESNNRGIYEATFNMEGPYTGKKRSDIFYYRQINGDPPLQHSFHHGSSYNLGMAHYEFG